MIFKTNISKLVSTVQCNAIFYQYESNEIYWNIFKTFNNHSFGITIRIFLSLVLGLYLIVQ